MLETLSFITGFIVGSFGATIIILLLLLKDPERVINRLQK